MAGRQPLEKALKETVNSKNTSFLDATRSAGYAKGICIGIVTAIAAPASIKVDFEGNGGHAGVVLMPNRFAYTRVIVFLKVVNTMPYRPPLAKPPDLHLRRPSSRHRWPSSESCCLRRLQWVGDLRKACGRDLALATLAVTNDDEERAAVALVSLTET
ncbi:hypothetical protein Vadar_030462 [Vaccinium darrowii]|uniref:Uncharacterized protein n=1 Tax=Vaccinium darrowii TaxID=229202 RepID=A0ACB7XV59_9ERIC|nr:hypothetical protein Vadar_030462 [Vaccinium darrowii]